MRYHFLLLIISSLLLSTPTSSQCMDGCTDCTNPYKCIQCQSGKQCCASTCQTCINQVQCIQCQSPYTLNKTSGICMLSVCPIGCSQCNNQICQSCDGGSRLEPLTNQCLPCPANCQSCGNNTQCSSCIDRYYLTTNFTCSQCPQNCFSCKNATNCSACVNGFYLSSGKCVQCTPNCQFCTSISTCSNCSAGFYLNSNSQCIACQTACSNCSGPSNCTACMTGFGLFRGVCANCKEQFTNCTSCGEQKTSPYKLVCNSCQTGSYQYNETTCKYCGDHCNSCSSSTYCSECESGFYFNSVACVPCVQPNCLECSGGSICTSCSQGTFLLKVGITTSCELCPEGCQSCQSQISCLTCNSGYYSNQNQCFKCSPECQTCIGSSYKCGTCSSGFYLDTTTFMCIPCPAFCPSCQDGDHCTECVPGYYISNNQCEKCSTENCFNCKDNKCTLCSSTYYLDGKSCSKCPENCNICLSQDSCQSCHQGYFLNDTNLCEQCQKNCSFCTSRSECSSCVSGFFQSGNSCQACHSSCSQCLSNNKCTSCVSNKYLQHVNGLSTGQCLQCQSPCQTCSSKNVCQTCVIGFYLSESGVCSQCADGCAYCNRASGCLSCMPNYVLLTLSSSKSLYQQKFCSPCPQNCHTCEMDSDTKIVVCTKCAYEYAISSIGDCYICGKGVTVGCKECKDDIMSDEEGNGTQIVYSCSSCMPGFMINDTSHYCIPDEGGSSSGVFFIICIIALAIGCAIVLGMIIYECCKSKDQGGMYKEIA